MAIPAAVLNILVTANTGGAAANLTRLDRKLKGTAATASSSAGRVASAAKYSGLAIAGLGAISVSMAVDFEKSMRNVNSIAQLPEKQFKKLNDQVLDLAGKTAQAPKTLAEGLYDLVSSGFDAAESIQILHKSALAATAGLTDTKTSTKAVAAVLNAYHLKAKKAGDISDVLFRTVDRGVITFEELSSTIGDVLPFASSLGVDLREVGAATATMTKAGISAPETMTRIKNVMVTLLKPGEALNSALHDLGFESGEAIIKAKGFQGALETLIGSTDGSKAAVAQLFPNIRSLGGALALTGDNAKGAGEDLKGMQDASGATARALDEQSKSLSFQWQKFKADASAAAIELGNKLIPELKDLLEIITNPKIELDEKISQIGDKLADVVEEWAPKLVKSGAMLSLAIFKGIANSDVWTKLAAAAWLIKAMGGFSKLKLGGKGVGTVIGRGLGIGILAGLLLMDEDIQKEIKKVLTKLKETVTGELLDATPREDFAHQLTEWFSAEAIDGSDLKFIGRTKVAVATEFGRLIFNAKTQELVGVANKKLKGLVGKGVGDVVTLLHSPKYQRMFEPIADAAHTIEHPVKQSMDQVEKALDDGAESWSRSTKDIGKSVDGLSGKVGKGMGKIVGFTNSALKAFGAKPLSFSLSAGTQEFDALHRQHGGLIPGLNKGAIVPGAGSGDKVPLHIGGRLAAMVEPKEYVSVANRTATAALMGVNAQIKRGPQALAAGGMVDPAGPGTGVVNPAIAGVVGAWSQKYNAAINYGFDPGGGHLSPGHNITGTATDTGPAAGWETGTALFEQGLRAIEGQVDQILYGSHGIGTPYPDHGWGNHAHIEWGMHPDVQGAIKATIKRVLLDGPAGPLLGMGQRALDKVRGAAQDYLGRKGGMSGGADIGPQGNYKGPLDRVFPRHTLANAAGHAQLTLGQTEGLAGDAGFGGGTRRSPIEQAAIALRESTLFPGVVSWDGGWGLYQHTPVAGGWGDGPAFQAMQALGGLGQMLNPWKNSQMAYELDRVSASDPWSASAMNGGVIAKLREGGVVPSDYTPNAAALLDVKAFAEQIKNASGPGEIRDLVSHARDQINNRTALDFLTEDGDLADILKRLRAEVDLYADNAAFTEGLNTTAELEIPESAKGANARELLAGLTVFNPLTGKALTMAQLVNGIGDQEIGPGDSVTVDIPAMFEGLTQTDWLTRELDPLWNLRNQLIVKDEKVGSTDRSLKDLVNQIQGSGGLLAQVAGRINEINQHMRQLEKDAEKLRTKLEKRATEREELMDGLRDARDKQRDRDSIIKQINQEKGKPHPDKHTLSQLQQKLGGKPDQTSKINQIETNLAKNSVESAAIKDALGRNHNQHGSAVDSLGRQTDLRGALKDKLMPVLDGRRSTLATGETNLLDELRTVQGSGVSLDLMEELPRAFPPIFKGELGQALIDLHDLGAKVPTVRADELSEPDTMHIQDLVAFSQAVMAGAFKTEQYMGAFAKGGVALVGERGPELAHLPSGTRVHSADDTRSMLSPTVEIKFAEGMEWLEQFMDVKIDGRLQQRKRASRGLVRAGVRA